jgi:vacuolar protein sorting-associated protein 35
MDAAVSVELFVEILNRYVYYFDQENDAVSSSPELWPINL